MQYSKQGLNPKESMEHINELRKIENMSDQELKEHILNKVDED